MNLRRKIRSMKMKARRKTKKVTRNNPQRIWSTETTEEPQKPPRNPTSYLETDRIMDNAYSNGSDDPD